MNTLHANERTERFALAQSLGGTPHATFKVDKGHPNGAELHTVMTSGVIIIRNARTKKIVTCLIARVGQIKRYGITDESILENARANERNGLNYK